LRKGSNKQEVAAIFPSNPKGNSVGGGELNGGSSLLGMVRYGGINRLNPYLARDLID
jgi:hypothetical protein